MEKNPVYVNSSYEDDDPLPHIQGYTPVYYNSSHPINTYEPVSDLQPGPEPQPISEPVYYNGSHLIKTYEPVSVLQPGPESQPISEPQPVSEIQPVSEPQPESASPLRKLLGTTSKKLDEGRSRFAIGLCTYVLIILAMAGLLIWYYLVQVCTIGLTCGTNGGCIKSTQWCDGRKDCPYGEDEAYCFRFYGPNFMLQSYSSHDQKWKSVCSYKWDTNIGQKTCEQMGYNRSEYISSGETKMNFSAVGTCATLQSTYPINSSAALITFFTDNATCQTNAAVTLQCINCGMRVNSNSRIIGGQTVKNISVWPWQVSLSYLRVHNCGGSIISRFWIITSADCVFINKQIRRWRVRVGKLQLSTMRGGYNVSKIILHPSFSAQTSDYNVALIKLKEPLNISDAVQPVCLPNDGLSFTASQDYYVAGWGLSAANGNFSDNLLEAKIPLINTTVCNSTVAFKGQITGTMFCAGNMDGGLGTCRGDMGDPLVSELNSLWWLVGNSIWDKSCGLQNQPGIYGNMTDFVSWIQVTMQNN